jgi:hypothetical protein
MSSNSELPAKPGKRVKSIHAVVTKDIIETAIPRDSAVCLLAEAIRAAVTFDASGISCDIHSCRVTDRKRGLRYIYPTPRQAAINLANFEHGILPQPFVFKLTRGQVVRSYRSTSPKAKKDGLGKKSVRMDSGGSVHVSGGQAPKMGPGAFKRRRVFGMRQGPGLPTDTTSPATA